MNTPVALTRRDYGVIVADVGGTNSRIQYYNNRTDVDPIDNIELRTSSFKSLADFLTFFIKGLGHGFNLSNVDVVICIASMVVDNIAQTSANFDWSLSDGNQIKEDFGFNSVTLFNDFKACGYALAGLASEEITLLTSGPEFSYDLTKNNSKYILVGPGTGLGVCTIAIKDGQTIVLSTESGHIHLPGLDNEVIRLLAFVKKETGLEDYASVEKIFCGRGIPRIYRFVMAEKGKAGEIEDIQGKEITRRALEERDPICLEVVRIFFKVFGCTLGVLQSILLPKDGIVLCQGIVQSLKDLLAKDFKSGEDSVFLSAMRSSNPNLRPGREVPIYLCSKYNLGIFGCLQYAKEKKSN